MIIGIGGCGGKIAAMMGAENIAVNVSQVEMSKLQIRHSIPAFVNDEHGQYVGSRKDPGIGQRAYQNIKVELWPKLRGQMAVTSTGGGTGNGIVSGVLNDLALAPRASVPMLDRTQFLLVLPHAQREADEYITNTVAFLEGPLAEAVDSANTGNIYLFSNREKFDRRLSEADFNRAIVTEMEKLMSIPEKGRQHELMDGHIDDEDFREYVHQSFFNYFSMFDLDGGRPFHEQFNENGNPLLLRPSAEPIKAMFLLECPDWQEPNLVYTVLDHFNHMGLKPLYSVIRNGGLARPRLTISMLYRRNPEELIQDYRRAAETNESIMVERTLRQNHTEKRRRANLDEKAERFIQQQAQGADKDDIKSILKRLGKY